MGPLRYSTVVLCTHGRFAQFTISQERSKPRAESSPVFESGRVQGQQQRNRISLDASAGNSSQPAFRSFQAGSIGYLQEKRNSTDINLFICKTRI